MTKKSKKSKVQVDVFYRVVTPLTFSDLHAKTLDEAIAKKIAFGECPNGTPENKSFWAKQRDLCKIIKVIEITEEIA